VICHYQGKPDEVDGARQALLRGHSGGDRQYTDGAAERDGLLAGGSSGAVIHAALPYAKALPASARVVISFPDSASRSLSTIFNNAWMHEKGIL
jgi:hypothetical protein